MYMLNVPTPEEVRDYYRGNSEAAADSVRHSLDEFLWEIARKSRSFTMIGYKAVKVPSDKETIIKLKKSGIELNIGFTWLIYAKKSKNSTINVFDLLNEGRPRLPKKRGKKKVYVLWGAPLRSAKKSDAQHGSHRKIAKPKKSKYPRLLSNARIRDRGEISGDYPFSKEHSAQARAGQAYGREFRGYPMVFSKGPLAAVRPKKLYERAWKRGKAALAGSGFRGWKLIVAKGISRGEE
jgi:hypothetical protein